MQYLLVFIGSGLSSISRVLVGGYFQQHWQSQLPPLSLIVNVISSFILGRVMAWIIVKPSAFTLVLTKFINIYK